MNDTADPKGTEQAEALHTGIDWRVVITGALVGASIALPAGIVARIFSDMATVNLLGVAVILFGLATGGFAAGQRRPDLALAHGALSGLVAYVGIQALGVATSLARGEQLRPLGYPLLAMLSTSAGVFGAFIATRQAQRPRSTDGADQEAAT